MSGVLRLASQRGETGECTCYEVWDSMGRLAYVGIADDFPKRWSQHLRMSWWLGEIEIWYVDVRGYRSRLDARMAEAAAINEQSPVYNTAHEAAAYREYLYRSSLDTWSSAPVGMRRFLPEAVAA